MSKKAKKQAPLIPPSKDPRGYTAKELDLIIPDAIKERFYEALGVNTVMCDPDGTTYTYAYDVDRALRSIMFGTPMLMD